MCAETEINWSGPRRLVSERAEIDAYLALRREMLVDAPWAFGSSPGDDRGSDAAQVGERLGRDDAPLLGMFRNGELVAVAGVMRESKRKRRHVASVTGVYVTPSARGRGLSRLVVGAAIAAARTWRDPAIVTVELSVSERSPAARRVYESLGFVAWGTEPDALMLKLEGRMVLLAEVHLRLALA